jgi:cytochrome c-type biogenesis protein CcmE
VTGGWERARGRRVALVAVVLVAAVAYLLFSGLKESVVYCLTVDEYVLRARGGRDGLVHVGGRVAFGTIRWDPASLTLSFDLEGEAARIPVTYRGLRPPDLGDGRQLVVEGRPDGRRDGRGNGTGGLVARRLIFQCPSRYEPAGGGK